MYRCKMRLISNRRCFVVPSNGPSFQAGICVGYNLPTLVNWFAKCLTPRKHKFYRTVFWLYKSKMFVILSCETKHYRSVWRNGITMETFHIMCSLADIELSSIKLLLFPAASQPSIFSLEARAILCLISNPFFSQACPHASLLVNRLTPERYLQAVCNAYCASLVGSSNANSP